MGVSGWTGFFHSLMWEHRGLPLGLIRCTLAVRARSRCSPLKGVNGLRGPPNSCDVCLWNTFRFRPTSRWVNTIIHTGGNIGIISWTSRYEIQLNSNSRKTTLFRVPCMKQISLSHLTVYVTHSNEALRFFVSCHLKHRLWLAVARDGRRIGAGPASFGASGREHCCSFKSQRGTKDLKSHLDLNFYSECCFLARTE